MRDYVKAAGFTEEVSELNLAHRVDQSWILEREIGDVIHNRIREPPVFVEFITHQLVFEGLLSI